MTNWRRVRSVTLAQAEAHLSQLLDEVEVGEEIVITRRGRPVARISRVETTEIPRLSVCSRAEFRSRLPGWRKASAKLLKEMREESL